jgi:hypothetical protein
VNRRSRTSTIECNEGSLDGHPIYDGTPYQEYTRHHHPEELDRIHIICCCVVGCCVVDVGCAVDYKSPPQQQ